MRLVAATLERAWACADAGAGSLFVPFLLDPRCIGAICEASPLPVNILRGKGGPTHGELAAPGVARISHGHQPAGRRDGVADGAGELCWAAPNPIIEMGQSSTSPAGGSSSELSATSPSLLRSRMASSWASNCSP